MSKDNLGIFNINQNILPGKPDNTKITLQKTVKWSGSRIRIGLMKADFLIR
jgi:hypothetical protein